MPNEPRDAGPLPDLEQRIRARGVRVDERLALLRTLAQADAEQQLAERQRALLAEVRAAAAQLERELG